MSTCSAFFFFFFFSNIYITGVAKTVISSIATLPTICYIVIIIKTSECYYYSCPDDVCDSSPLRTKKQNNFVIRNLSVYFAYASSAGRLSIQFKTDSISRVVRFIVDPSYLYILTAPTSPSLVYVEEKENEFTQSIRRKCDPFGDPFWRLETIVERGGGECYRRI